jgi:hypothetical protein
VKKRRIAHRLTVLHLAVDGIRREDELPPKEEQLVEEAHAAVVELTEALEHLPDDVTRP